MPVTSRPSPLVDSKRLWQDLMGIAEYTEADRPYTRGAFSVLFNAGRNGWRSALPMAGCK